MEKFFKHPWVIVAGIAAITVFFAAQLPRARMDNNIIGSLPDNNPARITSKHLEAEYGDEIVIMVGLERPYGTVFDGAFLSLVKDFTEAVGEIDMVKDTSSLVSAPYITSDSESIIVTDLVGDDFTGTPEEIAELKRRVASWDLYQGSLVSDNLSAAQIMVTINAASDESGNPEVIAVLFQIRDMAKEMFAGYASVYTAGLPVAQATATEASAADVSVLVPLVLVVLLGVLVFSFRRLTYVTLPLLAVLISTIWAIGAMPFLGLNLTILTSIVLPIILIAVGSAYAVHLISHYKDEIYGKTFTVEEHRAFVVGLVRKLIKPVFLAALTTFAGFISLCFTELSPIRDFAIFSSFGVIVAVIVGVTLIPAILLIRGPRAVKLAAQKKLEKKAGFVFETALAAPLIAVSKKKAPVLVITALVMVVSIIGTSKVVVDNNMIEWFKDDTEVSRSDRYIREHFGGSTQLIVSVEADDTQTLLSPQTLNALDGLCAYLIERLPVVTKVTGFTDMIKRMNQLFNVEESPEGIKPVNGANRNGENDDFGFGGFGGFEYAEGEKLNPVETDYDAAPRNAAPPAQAETPLTFALLNAAAGKRANMNANELVRELERMTNYEGYSYYEIPTDPARYGKQSNEELQQLISNYLVLLAGQSDNSFSNDPLEPTAIETMVLINSQWQKDTQDVIQAVNAYVEANFPKARPGALSNVRVFIGGGATQQSAVGDLIMNSQVISLIVSVLIVMIIVGVSYKSFAAGIIASLPLMIAILGNFAVMGFMHITINMGTALLASLSVGIGIDYTIHFIDAFKREYEAGGDYLGRTFAGAGKAILINTVSVGAGFAVLALSQFRILTQFGALIALSMGISAVVSLTVIPVLITTVKPKFIFGNNRRSA